MKVLPVGHRSADSAAVSLLDTLHPYPGHLPLLNTISVLIPQVWSGTIEVPSLVGGSAIVLAKKSSTEQAMAGLNPPGLQRPNASHAAASRLHSTIVCVKACVSRSSDEKIERELCLGKWTSRAVDRSARALNVAKSRSIVYHVMDYGRSPLEGVGLTMLDLVCESDPALQAGPVSVIPQCGSNNRQESWSATCSFVAGGNLRKGNWHDARQ